MLRPLNDRLVVRRSESEKETKGGIIIPDGAKEKPAEGEVLAIGPGRFAQVDHGSGFTFGPRRPMSVKPGDKILFGMYAGPEIDLDGEKYTVLSEDDVLGVLD